MTIAETVAVQEVQSTPPSSHLLLSQLVAVLSVDEHDNQLLTWSAEADTEVELVVLPADLVTNWAATGEQPKDYLRLQLDVLQRGDTTKSLADYDGPDCLSIARYLRLMYIYRSCRGSYKQHCYRRAVEADDDAQVDLYLLININDRCSIGLKTRLVET